jgi:hypothetical protein
MVHFKIAQGALSSEFRVQDFIQASGFLNFSAFHPLKFLSEKRIYEFIGVEILKVFNSFAHSD